jgi:hypothetical protein
MKKTEEDKPYCVKLDNAISDFIEIRRYGEVDGGFQRKLNPDVLNKIIETAKKGEAIPPIVLAKVEDGRYRLIDGQHRYEAWKRSPFDLFAQVNPMRAQKAVESFCTINGLSRRVSLSHQLNVDPGEYAKRVRETARKFDVEPRVIHNIARSVTGWHSGRNIDMSSEQWRFVETFITTWSKDPRWKSKRHVYSSLGTMLMAVRICRKSKKSTEIISSLQKLDYAVDSPLGERYASGADGIRRMETFALQSMMRKGLI